jgi:hypothetical protein
MSADGQPPATEPRLRRAASCEVCGAAVPSGARFCDHCGNPLSNSIGAICPQCRTLNLLGDAFCETCGTPLPLTPYLVATESGQRLNLFAEDQLTLIVGRADPLSGVLPDVDLNAYGAEAAGVSRRHVRLTHQGDQYWIEDLNSVNLTYLNNQRLTPDRPQPLKDGDLIRLGQLLLTFRSG